MRIKVVARETRYFVSVKSTREDEISDNSWAATMAFLYALSEVWQCSKEDAAKMVLAQIKMMRKQKRIK